MNKKTRQEISADMERSATRLDRLGSARFPTDTEDARLNALNARLNTLNESIEELAVSLLDNTTDKPASYYGGSFKQLSEQEAQELRAEIKEEL